MSRFPRLRRLFRFPFRTPTLIERDVETELSSHLERRAEELVDQGVGAEEARDEAVQQFGDLEYTKRYCNGMSIKSERRIRRRSLIDELLQDLKYGWRQLWRNPGFTLIAIVTLAVGIGANTAIFSVGNAVMLKTPVVDPDRVVQVREQQPNAFWGSGYHVRRALFVRIRDTNEVFERIAAIGFRDPTLVLDDGDALRGILALYVSADLFPILGVEPTMGRAFRRDEDEHVPEPAVIISHAFWQSEFGGAPDVLGRTLPFYIVRTTNDRNHDLLRRLGAAEDDPGLTLPFPVVGVLPPDFELPPINPRGAELETLAADVLLPFGFSGMLNRGATSVHVLGLLKPGVTLEHVRRQNVSDNRSRFLRDSSWFGARQLSRPGTPSFCAASSAV
jgi:hypothetical protein